MCIRDRYYQVPTFVLMSESIRDVRLSWLRVIMFANNTINSVSATEHVSPTNTFVISVDSPVCADSLECKQTAVKNSFKTYYEIIDQ